MVKRLTLIFLLLAGAANASVLTAFGGSGSIRSLSFGANDTIIVAANDTLLIDTAYSTTAPVVRMLFARSSGVISFSASCGLMSNALVLGNRASAPFSSSNGGKLIMTTLSYLYLKHDAGFTYDVEPGPNSTVSINVNVTNPANAAQIYMYLPATNGYGRFYVGNTTATISMAGVRFKGFVRSYLSGGVEFNASGRAPSTTTISKCFFDTSNVALIGVTGHKISQCTFNMPVINNGAAIMIWSGTKDTVIASTINVDANGGTQGDQKGIAIYQQDSTVVQGNSISELNSSAFGNNSYGVYMDGVSSYTQIRNNSLRGFGFTVASNASTNGTGTNVGIVIDSNSFTVNDHTHESIIIHDLDNNWKIRGNVFACHYGGGQSVITLYPSTTAPTGTQVLYNTVIADYGGASSVVALAFEVFGAGTVNYTTTKVIGNIFRASHSSNSGAGIKVGPNGTGIVNITFSEFKNNAYKSVSVASGSSVTYPYTAADSNKVGTTDFGFINASAGDFRLDAVSTMINCGDTTYGDSVFSTAQHSKIPYDIGYYQTYTTGTCGSSSPTPTGACCIAYTCYPGYTQTQCEGQGGTYQGDGTTTCTNCTAPPIGGGVGTGYGKRAWVSLATFNYGGTAYNPLAMAPFIGRTYDLLVNPGESFEDSVTVVDPNIGKLNYLTLSTFLQSSADVTSWPTFAATRGYNVDSGYMWANGSTVCLNAVAPNGAPCTTTETNVCSGSGNRIELCGWNTMRYMLNYRYVGMQQYIIYKVLQNAQNKGIMQDEACYVWQDTLTHSGSNSPWFPFASGYATSGSGTTTNAWTGSGLTNTQIADSLIHLKRSGWLAELMDSLQAHGQQIYSNGAAYGRTTSDLAGDMAILGAGILAGEGMNVSFNKSQGAFYPTQLWTFMDSIRTGGREWQNSQAIIWTDIDAGDTVTLTAIDGALGMKRRLAQERYAWYMMAQTPLRTFLHITLNWAGNGHQNGWNLPTDSLFKFCPSMNANLGAPVGGRATHATGTDGAGQTYTIYRRTFANGIVLWRGTNGTSYGTTSATTVALGATYYPVNYDGTYGTPTSTASIRNGEGLVFLTSTSSATGTLSIDNPTTPEGSNMVFTVTLSPSQTVPVSVNYITSPGSGAAITDYTDQSGTISFGIGQTTATISIPTADRAGCLPSRTFNVTLYGASPGTSITIPSPTATGTITDGDCGTPYNRTYKGKIVIKGKVRP